jgi:hypothetical protein
VQLELPWALGPPDGRYVLREAGAPTHVIVLATLGAAERRSASRRRARGRGRGREVAPEPLPTPVSTARATIVDALATDPHAAAEWLERADAATGEGALRQLAGMLRAHRVATADPTVQPPGLAHALVVRAGFGGGEEVAEGRWTRAVEISTAEHVRRRVRRSDVLRPQERLSALLGGRSHVLACEELALRARHDLDHGHLREGALQLRIALDAALAELPAAPGGDALAERIADLRARRDELTAVADAALGGVLAPGAEQTLGDVLGRLEAALRARTVAEATSAASE